MRAEEYEYLDTVYEQCNELEHQQNMPPKERTVENICCIMGAILMVGVILYFLR